MLCPAQARLEAEELKRAALLLAALAPAAAARQSTPPAPIAPIALKARAAEIAALIAGQGRFDDTFAPMFRDDVPPERFSAIAAQLKATLGPVTGVVAVMPAGPFAGTAAITFARGTASVTIALDPNGAHRVTGFYITGTTLADDSAAKLVAAFRALPGEAAFGIWALGDGEPRAVVEWHGERAAPIGSVFKLWLLAEASRQVRAGERHWDDVVAVGPPSLPSGILQGWPAGSPVTLHTLATLMISISDNTAADTMLALLGRDRVGALAVGTRSVDAARTLPVLSTREAFLVKADPGLRAAWARGDAAARAALLAREGARIAAAPLSLGIYTDGRPLANDSVEWFASPLDIARLLDRLRREGDPTTLAILAVNGGTQPATAHRFAYVGFKGGSEPGVIALDYLVRTQDGRWLAVTGSWHRPDTGTPADTFEPLMNRALALAAAQ